MPGNIEQPMMIASTMPFAANRRRASAYAATMPNSNVRTVVVPETMTELSRARGKLFFASNAALKFSIDIGFGQKSFDRPIEGRRRLETTIQ